MLMNGFDSVQSARCATGTQAGKACPVKSDRIRRRCGCTAEKEGRRALGGEKLGGAPVRVRLGPLALLLRDVEVLEASCGAHRSLLAPCIGFFS